MLQLLSKLRHEVAIGFVGGSDLAKQQEQLGTAEIPVTTLFDYCFAENGLTAYRMGVPLASHSFIKWIGEDNYKKLVRFILHYVADLDIPVKRGTFVEFRNGMINVSPIGRNASVQERNDYQDYDLKHKIREKFIAAIKQEFPDLGLTYVSRSSPHAHLHAQMLTTLISHSYSIGGQISFDVFPQGWDKRYCLQHIENEKNLPGGVEYTTIHFFGDKTFKGGNDHEIFEDPRTIGHSVTDPEDTMKQLKEIFSI
jgi:phosphomannomutase